MSFSKKSLAVIYGLAISKSLLEGFAIFQNTFRHPSFCHQSNLSSEIYFLNFQNMAKNCYLKMQ